MIGEAELRRKAATWSVDPMVVDLDYSLGWFVAAFYAANENASRLYFKGGTCLRKCYFDNYRFSEDLDFTATIRFDPERLSRWIDRASQWSADRAGPNYEAAPSRVEMLRDEYGGETYQVRVYYRGPLQWGGSPRAIRLDVTRDEVVMFSPQIRELIHPYSDIASLQAPGIMCYSLAEILMEKLRAIGGQRRFAVSRDLYDVHQLVRAGVIISEVLSMLDAKFSARGMDPAASSAQHLTDRRESFQDDWERRLSYLVHDEQGTDFETAWDTVVDVLQQIEGQRHT